MAPLSIEATTKPSGSFSEASFREVLLNSGLHF